MTVIGKASLRARSRPLVPCIPLQKVRSPRMSPRSLSSPTPSTLRNSSPTNSQNGIRIGLGASSSNDSTNEIKVSPRFGLDPSSPNTRSLGTSRATSKSDRQAKALAAHIARQRENRSEVSVRMNPLLGKTRIDSTASGMAAHRPNHTFSTRRKPVHQLSLDSANFSSILEGTTSMSDVGTDFDTCSLAESTSGKITTLCEKADVLMRELVEMVGPITPPLTPAKSVMRQSSVQNELATTPPLTPAKSVMQKENVACMEEDVSNPSVIQKSNEPCCNELNILDPPPRDIGSKQNAKEEKEEVSDLQFRISRLELQVSQITSTKTKQAAVAEDIAELRRWVEIAQAEVLATREEARDTKIQLDVLTKRASMLEIQSASYPSLDNSTFLDSSDSGTLPTESGRGVNRLLSVSSDGSQALRRASAYERPQVQLPRARSFDTVGRQRFYPMTRANNMCHQASQQPGTKEVVAPRRRSFPSPPRVVDSRMCTADQLVKGMQQNTIRLQKAADSTVLSANPNCTKPWRAHLCARPAKTANCV